MEETEKLLTQKINSLQSIARSPRVAKVIVRSDSGHMSEWIELSMTRKILILTRQ